ncbi:MAG TPA: DNA polymerase subunit beta [Acidiferrobacteraceae bacterium]|nr:DNA polymerase subunit beta [Acidiferrobacteraceae bacterium]
MNRSTILAKLREHHDEIERQYRVKQFSLFGSAARDELQEDSDIDVLVAFDGPATFDGYMGLKFYLEELLGREVDLVTESGLKPRARPHVEKDLIRVA